MQQLLVVRDERLDELFTRLQFGVFALNLREKPAIAEIDSNFEIVAGRNGGERLANAFARVFEESPLDKEAVDVRRLRREDLVFDIIGIEFGLHADERVVDGGEFLAAGCVHQVGVAVDDGIGHPAGPPDGAEFPKAERAVVFAGVAGAVIIRVNLVRRDFVCGRAQQSKSKERHPAEQT